MKILILPFLALMPIVFSAPVAVDKRSKEVILFGNRQNKPRLAWASKKNDHAVDNNVNPSLVDQHGSVHVVTPTETQHQTAADVAQQVAAVDSAKDLQQVQNEQAEEAKLANTAVVEELNAAVEPNVDTSAVQGADSAALDSQSNSNEEANTISDGQKEGEGAGDVEAESTPYKDELEDFYEYLLSYDNTNQHLPTSSQRDRLYPNIYPDLYSLRRKRSSQKSVTKGSQQAMKRVRRIKRDLLDDKAVYLNQYHVQERLPSDEELYEMFHSTAQNLQDLADLLDLYTEYQAPEAVAPPYAAYETYPTKEYEGENTLYSPGKREMLSSMPGLKKRFFYPSYDEPATHWGPFVPEQKREDASEEESYQRLLILAQALAGNELSPYYNDEYYKKK